jgi:hypothetical protein
MVRAGVGQAVAMTISGHKTASMFQRYNVTSSTDQLEALKRTASHLAAQPNTRQNERTVTFVAQSQPVSDGDADSTRSVVSARRQEHAAQAAIH